MGRGHQHLEWGPQGYPGEEGGERQNLNSMMLPTFLVHCSPAAACRQSGACPCLQEKEPTRGAHVASPPPTPWAAAARLDPPALKGCRFWKQLQKQPAAAFSEGVGSARQGGSDGILGVRHPSPPWRRVYGCLGFIQIPRLPLIPLEGITDK